MTTELIVREPEGLVERLASAREVVAGMVARAQEVLGEQLTERIRSAEDYDRAGTAKAEITKRLTWLDAERKQIVAPFEAVVDGVNAQYKAAARPALAAKDALVRGIALRFHEMKGEDGARVAASNAKALKNYGQRAARAEANGREEPPPPDMQEATVSKVAGGAVVRERWDFTVEDVAKVPEQYLRPREVNSVLVREAIKGGARQIPGLKIEQVVSVG